MKYIRLFLVLIVSLLGAACGGSERDPNVNEAPLTLGGQVFLRNEFTFKDNRSSEGASASFIKQDGTVYILTAKHLLGADMGISPSVNPSEFNNLLVSWIVYHNDDYEKPLAEVTRIINPNDNENEDIILLETNIAPENVQNMILPLTNRIPKRGERLFAIGCPYSEGELCSQNIYSGTVRKTDGNLVIFKADDMPDSLAGFSGAALVNTDGEIVAVIFAGSGNYIFATLLPDWIFNKHN